MSAAASASSSSTMPKRPILTWAAGKVERPIKWVSERSEGFISDAHGRDHVSEAELALDETGKFLGLSVRTIANMGGYLSTFGPNIPTNLYGLLLAGVYTTPRDLLRGEGRVHQHAAGRRLSRRAAGPRRPSCSSAWSTSRPARWGSTEVEIRRRNMIPKRRLSVPDAGDACKYDSGDPRACLDQALEVADWQGFAARKAESASARQAPRHRLLHLCRGLRPCAVAHRRSARRPRRPLRKRHGAGARRPATSRCMIGTAQPRPGPRDHLRARSCRRSSAIPADKIEIVFGDTDKVQFGLGTYGSRSLAVGGTGAGQGDRQDHPRRARRSPPTCSKRATAISSFEAGNFAVAGTDRREDRSATWSARPMAGQLSARSAGAGHGGAGLLRSRQLHLSRRRHIAEVEIDPDDRRRRPASTTPRSTTSAR